VSKFLGALGPSVYVSGLSYKPFYLTDRPSFAIPRVSYDLFSYVSLIYYQTIADSRTSLFDWHDTFVNLLRPVHNKTVHDG
jgi:hypothetical protein